MGHRPEQPRVHPDASIEHVSDLDLPVRAESPFPQGRDMSPLKRCLLLLNVALKDVAKPCRLRNSIRFRPLQRSLFGLPFGESGRGIYIKYIIGSSAFHWFLLYLNKALMRKTGIGLLVAAYVSALCTWLAAPPYARANAQAGLPILVVASALTLNGLHGPWFGQPRAGRTSTFQVRSLRCRPKYTISKRKPSSSNSSSTALKYYGRFGAGVSLH